MISSLRLLRKLFAQKEIANRKIEFLINIPRFLGVDLEHQRVIADTMPLCHQVVAIEDINA
jgi:hypothetical protein